MNTSVEAAHHDWAHSLWGLCYRMTGVAADADELVQETFVRVLEAKPRVSEEESLKPWLFSTATRLCIDRLRQRRSHQYKGPWLPSPVPNEALQFEAVASARYDVLESASIAFLLALEALSPRQRAAIILSDVFDLPAREVALHLQTSEANVRQLQHRGRAALVGYDSARVKINEHTQQQNRQALEGFFSALATGDIAAAQGLLAPEVKVLTDGGGTFRAAMVPIHGAERAVVFFTRLLEMRGMPLTAELRQYNGLWALDTTFDPSETAYAPHAIAGVVLNAQGQISLLYSMLEPRKLRPRSVWSFPNHETNTIEGV